VSFDYGLTLINYLPGENEIGDPIIIEDPTTILCDVLSVQRSEFYQADVKGLKPEIVFSINKYDYSGQGVVEFEGKRYSVIRSYVPKNVKVIGDFDKLELTCSGLVNVVT
jgi:hypothetical protein